MEYVLVAIVSFLGGYAIARNYPKKFPKVDTLVDEATKVYENSKRVEKN